MLPKTIPVLVGGPETPSKQRPPKTALATVILFTSTDRSMRRALEAGLKPLKLGIMQWLALGLIAAADSEGISSRQLAAELGIAASQTTSLTASLLKLVAIHQKPQRSDYRTKLLTLTAKGRGLADDAEQAVQRALEDWLKPLPDNYRGVYEKAAEVLGQQRGQ